MERMLARGASGAPAGDLMHSMALPSGRALPQMAGSGGPARKSRMLACGRAGASRADHVMLFRLHDDDDDRRRPRRGRSEQSPQREG